MIFNNIKLSVIIRFNTKEERKKSFLFFQKSRNSFSLKLNSMWQSFPFTIKAFQETKKEKILSLN
jgi:hypothetical protein